MEELLKDPKSLILIIGAGFAIATGLKKAARKLKEFFNEKYEDSRWGPRFSIAFKILSVIANVIEKVLQWVSANDNDSE